MDSILWLLIVASLIMFAVRWIFGRTTPTCHPQMVRHLFLHRLLAQFPEAEVVESSLERVLVRIHGIPCTVQFEQLFRRCMEAPTRMAQIVRQAVDGFVEAMNDVERMPEEWERAVLPLAVNRQSSFPAEVVLHPVVDDLALGYVLQEAQTFRWVTRAMCEDATVSEEDLHAIALRNLERSCNALVIDAPGTLPDGQERLLRFATGDGLDATRLLLPSFFQRFAPRFGENPLLVAIPSRDSLIMIDGQDQALATVLAWRSAREYRHRPYPLCAQLFLVQETGVQPWRQTAVSREGAGAYV